MPWSISTAKDRLARAPLHAADLQGVSRLVIDATVGVVDLVESMHHTIAGGSGIVGKGPQGSMRGLTGLVYRTVRGVTRLTGQGLDAAWGAAARLWPEGARPDGSARRDAALAAVNGVWGDHLHDTANPLAIPMRLRSGGAALDLHHHALKARFAQAGGRIVVLVHGLCMNDRQWLRGGHDHGQALAHDLGATALYLHYNSGRHVSDNGREFAHLLEDLVAQWPVPVTELLIVGHSMGGLVARSACHVGTESGSAWPALLRALVLLGTPHHGAPLERGGQLVDRVLGFSPYSAPFAKLGRTRSAGITDLRFGNVQEADRQGRDGGGAPGHRQRHDKRVPTPLPAGVKTFVVAATTAAQVHSLRSKVLGDGLVRLDSALGHHRDPALDLAIPSSRQFVITRANHWDLLGSREVCSRMRDWLR